MGESSGIGRAGFGRRLAATAIDLCTIAAVSALLGMAAGSVFGSLRSDIADQTQGYLDGALLGALIGLIAGFALVGAVYMLFELTAGGTPGKRALGLVIRADDARPAPWGMRLARYLVKNSPLLLALASAIPGFWFAAPLTMLSTLVVSAGTMLTLGHHRQALHDIVARTAVYRKADVRTGSEELGAGY